MFSNEIVKDGWKYTSLTEDRSLTADCVVEGYEISYNNDAVFYDEQPTDLKVALRQRLRWSEAVQNLLPYTKLWHPLIFNNKYIHRNPYINNISA